MYSIMETMFILCLNGTVPLSFHLNYYIIYNSLSLYFSLSLILFLSISLSLCQFLYLLLSFSICLFLFSLRRCLFVCLYLSLSLSLSLSLPFSLWRFFPKQAQAGSTNCLDAGNQALFKI